MVGINKPILGLDVDHTCTHEDGLPNALQAFGTTIGVNAQIVQSAVAPPAKSFTCQPFLDAINRPHSLPQLEHTLATLFRTNMYDDVVPFLHWARQRYRLVVVSRGNAHFQSLKINPFRNLIDDVIITDRPGQKGQVLRDRYNTARHVTVIDDRYDELHAVQLAYTNMSTRLDLYQIIRANSVYPVGTYCRITSLNEIKHAL
ncbi:MAG TPA: hypothetical protein VMY99_04335 [Nevskiaceae bacterium]|nr:hypothetical protein [Nevskiaceae bacterium]